MQSSNSRTLKMGTAPMLPLILSMSLPSMFSMLIQALYNIVDSYFIAKLDADAALTAVSLAYPLQMLMVSVSVGTSIGVNSLISRRLGQNRPDDASKAATSGILLAICSWFVFALLGIFAVKPYFEAFTDSARIIDLGISYTSIVMILSFGVFVEMSIQKMLQATGNMIYPMTFQLVGAVLNIIFDPIFIFGMLGVPAMGVAGAAIATVLGQIIAMIYALIVLFTQKHTICVNFKKFRPSLRIIKDIYAVGMPSIIMQSIGSVMVTALNTILITFSSAAVSVFGIYFKLQSFVFMPVFGMTHGVMPIMGYNFGACNKKRLLSALKISMVLAACIMSLGTALFVLFPRWLMSIFSSTEEMYDIGIRALPIISLCFIPAAAGIMFSTLFQAVGKGINSLAISLLRQLVIIVPAAYLLAKTGLSNVWFAFPIAEIAALGVSVILFRFVYKHDIRTLIAMPDNIYTGSKTAANVTI